MLSAERRDKTNIIIKKRMKQMLIFFRTYAHPFASQPNRFNKSQVIGCKRCRCSYCHPQKRDKYYGIIETVPEE